MISRLSLLSTSGILFFLLFSCHPCYADLSTYTSASANNYPQLGLYCNGQYGTSTSVCFSSTFNVQANANYGTLSDSASVVSGFSDISVYALSTFTDTLTIDAPVSSGFVDYSFLVNGHSLSSDGGFFVTVTQSGVQISQPNIFPAYYNELCCNPAKTLTTSSAPFTSGVPFSLVVNSQVDSYFSNDTNTPYIYGISDADQVALTGISIFDASGNPVTSGVTVHSNLSTYNGLVTDDSPTATPEPSLGILLTLALAGLVWAHRGRTARNRSSISV